MLQVCHDSLRRSTVPFQRNGALLPLTGHQARKGGREFARIGSDQLVGPDRDGLRPFGVVAQGQAWDAEHGRLFARSDVSLPPPWTDHLSVCVCGELMRVRPGALWMFWDGGPEFHATCLLR